jgi:putative DNA primase/helicase
MMDIRTMARALGGNVTGHGTMLVPGPGHSSRDRSLSIKLDPQAPDGLLIYSHAGDDWRACRNYVRSKLGLPDWRPGDEQDRRVNPAHALVIDQTELDHEAEKRPRTEDDLDRIARALAIWDEGGDPHGSPVEQYLHARRLDGADFTGDVLRFHPRCPWRDENTGRTIFIPCLIAAFRSIDDGMLTGIHRIRLDQPQRWPKTERRMLGIVARAAIQLDPLGDGLAIGEGVETCLAARILGIQPAWALGSVGAISGFPILDGIKHLHILGETGEASQTAIKFCGRRWKAAGRRVRIITPKAGLGSDINDVLIARSAAQTNNKAPAENQGRQEERKPEILSGGQ